MQFLMKTILTLLIVFSTCLKTNADEYNQKLFLAADRLADSILILGGDIAAMSAMNSCGNPNLYKASIFLWGGGVVLALGGSNRTGTWMVAAKHFLCVGYVLYGLQSNSDKIETNSSAVYYTLAAVMF